MILKKVRYLLVILVLLGVNFAWALDADGDGIDDAVDNCPSVSNASQADYDNDGLGNPCDADGDNDGWSNSDEVACGTNFLNAASMPTDTDGDLTCNALDEDDDNDGYLDVADVFPLDKNEWADNDDDGIGDNADTDDDNDFMPDDWEVLYGLDPYVDDGQEDLDGDRLVNRGEYINGSDPTVIDGDPDGDGIHYIIDNCDDIANPNQLDNDNDHDGDLCDTDDDNDNMPDDWENLYGLNSFSSADASQDVDGDSLTNYKEYQEGTNPVLSDSDGDDSSDDEELAAGTDPNNSGQRPYWWKTFYGDDSYDRAGISVSGAGDINNDGYDDVIVGAEDDDNSGDDSGSIKIYSGLDGDVLHFISGSAAGDNYGRSVSELGDVNEDGYADFIVGARWNESGVHTGTVYGYSGKDGSLLYRIDGENLGDNFSKSISEAGDVNNDGYPDFIVGVPAHDPSGLAQVFSGMNGSLLRSFSGFGIDAFGDGVSGVGDINKDGYDDLLIGAPVDDTAGNNAGNIYLRSGFDGALLQRIYGYDEEIRLGSSVSGLGDVNKDGYNDFIVGAPFDKNASIYPVYPNSIGSAHVYSGQDYSLLYSIFGGSFNSVAHYLGRSVADAGDINNDGYADFIIGAPNFGGSGYGIDVGAALVYSGKTGQLLFMFKGESDYMHLGNAVDNAGDVDADGHQDLIIGISAWNRARVLLYKDLINDVDLDYLVNAADPDDDNDGVLDAFDDFPLDAYESVDTDYDGVGNNADNDDDGDGIEDALDGYPLDTDNDGVDNIADLDDDNDGVPDSVDADPLDNANSTEISLPLDGFFKGSLQESAATHTN